MMHALHLIITAALAFIAGYLFARMCAVGKRDDEMRREIVERREADWREKIIKLHEER